jgi:hypothetical protein
MKDGFFRISFLLLSILLTAPAAADPAALKALVAKKAGVVELLHGKAERALVTAAQDKTFTKYFEAQTDEERARLRDRIGEISLAVQKQFAVEEMCLINRQGAEISRIVGKQIAYDLSTQEAQTVFFAPAFAQAPRTVYRSPIYISPDAHRWVTAYATPILIDGEKKAILHYEHGLDFYEHTVNAGLSASDHRVLVTMTKEGWVIFDSRKDIPIEQVKGSDNPGDYFAKFSLDGLSFEDIKKAIGAEGSEGSGNVVASGGKSYDVAFKEAGYWTLIAFEPAQPKPT